MLECDIGAREFLVTALTRRLKPLRSETTSESTNRLRVNQNKKNKK